MIGIRRRMMIVMVVIVMIVVVVINVVVVIIMVVIVVIVVMFTSMIFRSLLVPVDSRFAVFLILVRFLFNVVTMLLMAMTIAVTRF